MSDTKNGVSAFPHGPEDDTHGYPITVERGMTLRDYFAAAAIPIAVRTLEAVPKLPADVSTETFVAVLVYKIADAMLAARDK